MDKFQEFILNENSENKIKAIRSCQELVACLKATQWVHQTSFWHVKGESHYGLHEMMKHVLDPIDEQLSDLGDMLIIHLGDEAMDARQLDAMSKKYCSQACSNSDPVSKSLAAEKEIQKNCREAYDSLKEAGMLTLGLDEMLMGLAKEHEDALYHLTRTIKK